MLFKLYNSSSRLEGSWSSWCCEKPEMFAISINDRIFLNGRNLYFCQQICCLLYCEYWIMDTNLSSPLLSFMLVNRDSLEREWFYFIFFQHKLKFPSHRNCSASHRKNTKLETSREIWVWVWELFSHSPHKNKVASYNFLPGLLTFSLSLYRILITNFPNFPNFYKNLKFIHS